MNPLALRLAAGKSRLSHFKYFLGWCRFVYAAKFWSAFGRQ